MEGNATSKRLVGTVSSNNNVVGSMGTVFSVQTSMDIPTNVSAFVNDAGYITAEALEGYALASAVAPISDDYVTKEDLADYALKSEIPTIPTKVSAFTNDAGYLTQHQSLEGYALKTEIPNVSAYQTREQVLALIQENMPTSGDEVSY